jgi:hypothetical protein
MNKEYEEIAKYDHWREKRHLHRLAAVSVMLGSLYYWVFFG